MNPESHVTESIKDSRSSRERRPAAGREEKVYSGPRQEDRTATQGRTWECVTRALCWLARALSPGQGQLVESPWSKTLRCKVASGAGRHWGALSLTLYQEPLHPGASLHFCACLGRITTASCLSHRAVFYICWGIRYKSILQTWCDTYFFCFHLNYPVCWRTLSSIQPKASLTKILIFFMFF